VDISNIYGRFIVQMLAVFFLLRNESLFGKWCSSPIFAFSLFFVAQRIVFRQVVFIAYFCLFSWPTRAEWGEFVFPRGQSRHFICITSL